VRISKLKKKKNTTPGIFTEPKERLMVEQTKEKRNGKFPKAWRFQIRMMTVFSN
jgi:hypothetical protein